MMPGGHMRKVIRKSRRERKLNIKLKKGKKPKKR
jgi:hypothetical protein